MVEKVGMKGSWRRDLIWRAGVSPVKWQDVCE